MLKILCCCITKNSIEEVKNKADIIIETKLSTEKVETVSHVETTPQVETVSQVETNQTFGTIKSDDFNPSVDSIVNCGTLDTVYSNGTMSDNDSTVAVVNDSQEDSNHSSKKKLKSSYKYLLGKNISHFYLSINRYYFIKNKNDDKEVYFGKFINIDKSKNICAVFQITSVDRKMFDALDYSFFRAIPKHK